MVSNQLNRMLNRPMMIRCALNSLQFRSHTRSALVASPDVIVGGGGLVGISIAYHLARRGKYVYLFERGVVGVGGATSVNPGLITAPLHWQEAAKQFMAKHSLDLYADLAKYSTFRYNRCGRLYLTSTVSGSVSLRRMFSRAQIYDEAAEISHSTEEIRRWLPSCFNVDDVHLALFSPNDIALDSVGLCRALADRAREHGVVIVEECMIEDILLNRNNKVIGAVTNKGRFDTNCFIDATGICCGTLLVSGLPSHRVSIAAHPATYVFLMTKNLKHPEISANIPIVTHIDEKIFLRLEKGQTICGGFTEEQVKPLKQKRETGEWLTPTADWDKFGQSLEFLLARCPLLGELECGELICAGESYTPDKNPVIGEVAGLSGYFVATGFSGHGLSFAGGVGQIMADLICGSTPSIDISRLEVTRFIDMHANPLYLCERVPEVAGKLYSNSYDYHQYRAARNFRTSPLHHELKRAGAVFGEVMGFERPLWFGKSGVGHPSMNSITEKGGKNLYCGQFPLIGKPEWFDMVSNEYEACRERVALMDLSNLAKFDIEGPDVVKFLQRLCSANVDVPIGTIVYSGMQNERGGYVSDSTLCRLGPKHYFAIVPSVQQLRFKLWLQKWMKKWNHKIFIQDITGQYTALNVLGPSSRRLLEKLTDHSVSRYDFPTFSAKKINIGMAIDIRALCLSHTGELGWVLYIPNEMSLNVFESLLYYGEEFGLMHAGHYTLKHLRVEKFFVHWGKDIHPGVTPLECGRVFRVDFGKKFIGKNALLRQQETGIRKRCVQIFLSNHDQDTDPWPQGGELIYRFGVLSGRTTSAAYGFTVGCQVCIGYIESDESMLTNDYLTEGKYEVDIAGKFFPARINLFSPVLPMYSSELTAHYLPTR